MEVDGRSMDLDAMLVVVGNSIAYGGGMRVLQQASLIDGELDVCVVAAMSTAAFLRAAPKVYLGKHVTPPKVTMLRGKQMKIEADRRMMVYADGENVGPLPALFGVMPGAMPLVVGPKAKALR